jgi:hypothetical protein
MSMSSHGAWIGGRLVELREDECWELLATRPVGRIAFDDVDGIAVLPVNHEVREKTIVFRTSPHSTIARRVNGEPVTFQVDDIEEFHQSGWSVMFRGRADIADIDLHGGAVDGPLPWPEGLRPVVVRIEPHRVTGRRLLGG